MTYANRIVYVPRKAITAKQAYVGVRIPLDLVGAMDRFCRDRGVRRTDLVVAALRAHLSKPSPAATPVGEK